MYISIIFFPKRHSNCTGCNLDQLSKNGKNGNFSRLKPSPGVMANIYSIHMKRVHAWLLNWRTPVHRWKTILSSALIYRCLSSQKEASTIYLTEIYTELCEASAFSEGPSALSALTDQTFRDVGLRQICVDLYTATNLKEDRGKIIFTLPHLICDCTVFTKTYCIYAQGLLFHAIIELSTVCSYFHCCVISASLSRVLKYVLIGQAHCKPLWFVMTFNAWCLLIVFVEHLKVPCTSPTTLQARSANGCIIGQ